MEKVNFKLMIYKIRYILYIFIIIFILVLVFNNINKQKQNLYNKIASYKDIKFLIKNGKRKAKTLSENYVRSIFGHYNIQLDYIKNKNGEYEIKANSVNIMLLAKIIYHIENDGFTISYLKAQDYSGHQDFDIRMEIKE